MQTSFKSAGDCNTPASVPQTGHILSTMGAMRDRAWKLWATLVALREVWDLSDDGPEALSRRRWTLVSSADQAKELAALADEVPAWQLWAAVRCVLELDGAARIVDDEDDCLGWMVSLAADHAQRLAMDLDDRCETERHAPLVAGGVQ